VVCADQPSVQQRQKFPLHAGDPKEHGYSVWFKLDQQVNVAVWTKIGTERRTENRQPLDPMFTAECSYGILRHYNCLIHSSTSITIRLSMTETLVQVLLHPGREQANSSSIEWISQVVGW
jgi:hypothetical protein